MTAKKTTSKTTAPKKATKPSANKAKPEQLKIAGTGRLDAIPEIEAQAAVYVGKRDERMSLQTEENDEQAKLTDLLKKHGVRLYKFEGSDGEPLEAYIPDADEPNAKVRKVKAKQEANA